MGPLRSSRQPGPNNIDRRMQTAAVELVSARPASQGVNSILESAVHTPTHRHTRPCTQWAVKASLHCQREASAHSRRVQRDRRPDSACSPVLQPTGCMGGAELLVRTRVRGPANRRAGEASACFSSSGKQRASGSKSVGQPSRLAFLSNQGNNAPQGRSCGSLD